MQDRTYRSDARFHQLPQAVPELERIARAYRAGDTRVLSEYGGASQAFRRLNELKREGDAPQRKAQERLDRQQRGEWRDLYQSQDHERETQVEQCRTLRGRVKRWREYGSRWRDLPGAIRGKPGVIDEWDRRLVSNHRLQRAALGREQRRAIREAGVSRLLRPGYREERFEAIGQARQALALISGTEARSQPLWDRAAVIEKHAEVERMIQALPPGDRAELERRDRKNPPPAFHLPAATRPTPGIELDTGPSR